MEDTPGKRLKALREGLAVRQGRPVSQAEVAAGSKVKLSSLQKWETDAQVPTGANLLKIARYYGIPPEHVISGAPIPEGTEDAELLLQTAAELRAMAEKLERRARKQTGSDITPEPDRDGTREDADEVAQVAREIDAGGDPQAAEG